MQKSRNFILLFMSEFKTLGKDPYRVTLIRAIWNGLQLQFLRNLNDMSPENTI